jgi:hypothetical protein
MHPRDRFPDLSPTDLADVIDNVLARKQAGQKIRLQDTPLAPTGQSPTANSPQTEARPSGSVPPRPSLNRQSPIGNRQSAGPQGESRVQQGDFISEKPLRAPHCTATTKSGETCRATPRAESGLCINHDPDYAGQQRENVRNGGIASGAARRLFLDDTSNFTLSDRASVQAVIDAILRLELAGKIPPSRSRVVVRLLSLAVRNFDRPRREGYYDAVVATHDPQTYAERRQALDTHLGDIVQGLEGDELNRRVWAIADVGSKRQEYLKANDLFAPPPKRRSNDHRFYDE